MKHKHVYARCMSVVVCVWSAVDGRKLQTVGPSCGLVLITCLQMCIVWVFVFAIGAQAWGCDAGQGRCASGDLRVQLVVLVLMVVLMVVVCLN